MTNESLTRNPPGFHSRNPHFLIIAALSFTILFARLHQGDLSGYDDAVYAHEGREMLLSGDWWNVRLNGDLDFDKPPMFIWMEALAMMIFGVSDLAAKTPAAFLGFGTILLIYLIARKMNYQYGQHRQYTRYWLPIWSMLILMGTQIFMKSAMHAMTDVPFTFFFTLAMFSYLKGLNQPRYFILCGISIGSAIFMRSIIGTIPIGIILIHLLVIGRIRLLRSGSLVCGLVLAFGLPLIWFISQYRSHGTEFLWRHFSYTLENVPDADSGGLRGMIFGLLEYPLLLLKTYWPWLPLMLIGFWGEAKKMLAGRDVASGLLVIWVICVLLPFSVIETKALRYIMPVFPAFSIIAAIQLDEWIPVHRKVSSLKIAYATLAVVVLILVVNPKYSVRPEEMRRLAPIAAKFTRPDQPILLYTNRKPEIAHLYQVIWYSERRCHLVTSGSVITTWLRAADGAIVADRAAFARSISNLLPDIELLDETENFVCFRLNSVKAAIPASQTRVSQNAESKE